MELSVEILYNYIKICNEKKIQQEKCDLKTLNSPTFQWKTRYGGAFSVKQKVPSGKWSGEETI